MTTPSRYKHFSYYFSFFPLLPSPEHSIPNVLRHILHGQFRIDFGCLYRGMPHHNLQYLFGYTLSESHRTGESVPAAMGNH